MVNAEDIANRVALEGGVEGLERQGHVRAWGRVPWKGERKRRDADVSMFDRVAVSGVQVHRTVSSACASAGRSPAPHTTV
jgi:hypothetical protein